MEIQHKREAAHRLAIERGLGSGDLRGQANAEVKPDDTDGEADNVASSRRVPEDDPVSPIEPFSTNSQSPEQSAPVTPDKGKFNDINDPT